MVKKPVIQFEAFSFQYKTQQKPTLESINLTIYQGEKVLILGSSGSGKSTLANCMNGLIPFSYEGTISGSCKINGVDTRDLSVFRLSQEVGTVLQDSDAQFVGLSVGEDIAFSMENDRVARHIMRKQVRENSALVGMEEFLDVLPFHLSGGQKQKVALAGVLGKTTNILIFDEPLASLDPKTGTYTIDLIDRIVREYQCTAVIIEHRLEDVLYRPVDRVILMDKGRIIADTVSDALLRSTLLQDYGIREPLYITAMKYAGCDLDAAEQLCDIDRITLSQNNREKLTAFFQKPAASVRPHSGEAMLQLEAVSYSYSERAAPAINSVSFTVHRGERLAIIGKNGAGKSTLAKLICGICRPTKGMIRIGGEDYTKYSVREIGKKVGYVMQDPNQMLVKDIIKDEVELALRLQDIPEPLILEKAKIALETCELYRFRNWPISAVSYGQKKRVTVASVLALEPDIIILDEPTAGQDYRHYQEIMEFINRLNTVYGKTIIVITHDMHVVIEHTDRALVFADQDQSSLLAEGAIFSLFANKAVLDRAHLKQTSLHILAAKLGLDPEQCIERYIQYERSVGTNE